MKNQNPYKYNLKKWIIEKAIEEGITAATVRAELQEKLSIKRSRFSKIENARVSTSYSATPQQEILIADYFERTIEELKTKCYDKKFRQS